MVILIYHRVGAHTHSAVDLPRDVFARQLAWLADQGVVITLDRALEVLAGRADPPPGVTHPVVVTFDDGTADWHDEVAPLLVEHGVPATFYVATQFVDDGIDFPEGGRPATWSGLAELMATGLATIGSHTHTHRVLGAAGADETRAEVDRSVALLEQHLQVPCRHFCYPKAVPGSVEARAVVQERFASATLAGSRVNVPGRARPHELWRVPLKRGEDMEWFVRKAAGGLQLEGTARAAAARVRYAGRSH